MEPEHDPLARGVAAIEDFFDAEERPATKRRWANLLLLVDLIGVIGVLTAIVGFFLHIAGVSASLLEFAKNFGVEIIGTWISVRIIEAIMRHRDDREAARTRVLRMSRFWLSQFTRLQGPISAQDIQHLDREIGYFEYMKGRWAPYLDGRERDRVMRIEAQIRSMLDRLRGCHEPISRMSELVRKSATAGRRILATRSSDPVDAIARFLLWQQGHDVLLDEWSRTSAVLSSAEGRLQGIANNERTLRAMREMVDLLGSDAIKAYFADAALICGIKQEHQTDVRILADRIVALEEDIREDTPEKLA